MGLLNASIVRSRSVTAYRGGDATSLREEFAFCGWPALGMQVKVGDPVIRALPATVMLAMSGAIALLDG